MNDERTISGQTTMIWQDQARSVVRPIVRVMIMFSVGMSAALFLVWATSCSDDDWLLLRREPLAALVLAACDAWPFFAGCFVLVLVMLVGWYARGFSRVPEANRRIHYEATRHGLTTRDAANFALTVPWTSVVRVYNSDHTMQMVLVAGASRLVFWRAFAAEDRAQVLNWARQVKETEP
ncbi:hypothetical protein [Bradyrhizobium liaoningense]|uniref:hypothetical protein n=1 Tax=Bradyrhizobium liaoningense TaxID=43992 RepID=UPI001BAC3003|nr:hypothetical protein [Bradyrhizobium liaoningense]MBR0717546.1 hypothetical protein [Bradyrhizobium liaoningense]